MTKKVLILGAGLVVRPIVHYLLKHNYHVTVASLIASQAENVVKNQPNGIAKQLDVVQEPEKLASEVSQHDIIVSLLPAIYHVQVAKVCLQYKKSLVTASYISPAMQELHEQALESNLLFLNECGLDPGLDHMGAMKTIHEVQKKGGKVVGYSSYCGGLPALASNNNPFQYKFSWSPVGVVKAAKNGARFLRNNEIVEIPADELFENYEFVEIPNCGTFEGYPNRNSLDYIKKYNLDGIRDMFRGTLRNIGHCETWRYFVRLGILQDEKKYDFTKISPAEVICELIGKEKSEDLFQDVADFLKIEKFSVTLHKLQWLGFFSYEKPKLTQGSVMDLFVHLLEEKLPLLPSDADLVILQHEFTVEYPDKKEKIISTLIDQGTPHGDTSMARTVSLPVAIATRMILEGKITLKGVHMPDDPNIYEPILQELAENNIQMQEKIIPLT